ncbi:MAG: hypothetical protein A3F10_05635 [Coxiella sp. RIFCSPHIGHO2_12_FULL_42_15]|nr:MAG: hypothetical protein A3F10_05635 [Coxiella sp. RIFCSPHIGHO2_12_FULL_42_15]
MSNQFISDDVIAKTALASFMNHLSLASTANIQYRDEFTVGRGDTIRIEKPVNFTVRSGEVALDQDFVQRSTSITVAHQDGVDMIFSSKQRGLELRKFNENVIEPAMKDLANQVDYRGIQVGLEAIYHTVQASGKSMTFADINRGRAFLSKVGVNPDYCLMNIDDATDLKNSLQNSFNATLNKNISERAALGNLAGLDIYESQNLVPHVVGVQGGTPLVNGGGQSGKSLKTSGWTPKKTVLNEGDIFYIENVYTVNPVTGLPIGSGDSNLQRFVVCNEVISDETGNAVINFKNDLVLSGPYKTVSQSPDDKAKITVLGKPNSTFSNNFIYSREAFSLACIRLPEPRGAGFAKTVVDNETGIAMRMIEDYDSKTDRSRIRFDVMYGWLCNPEYGVRVVV